MKNAFKVAVLGSPRVGKTTIIDEAIYGNHYRLKNPYEPTSEDIYCAMVEYDKNSREKIFLYDYGGMVFKCFMIFEIDFFFSNCFFFFVIFIYIMVSFTLQNICIIPMK